MDNEKTHVFTKDEWYKKIDGGLNFSMNDIDNADADGFIGNCNGIRCYVKEDVVDKDLKKIEDILFNKKFIKDGEHYPDTKVLLVKGGTKEGIEIGLSKYCSEEYAKLVIKWHNRKVLEELDKIMFILRNSQDMVSDIEDLDTKIQLKLKDK